MNASRTAQMGYGAATAPIRTPRGTEYEAFARITHRLRAAAETGGTGLSQLAEALHENRRLWTILAADVAEPGNSLPPQLRAQIFYLAEFTIKHSGEILRGKADAAPLIEINTAIMRGLRQREAAA
ncbi:flagellar biosynthesis regulatory protein FlaF [Maritimibacter sp. 55A14]|uniref:flagellar biosynthesis regulator FlaF n=1 Tax=Maritimibacter sp. 55A14 TaxID=2174844 RepID=UPI000D60BE84|nr:flagellar biosynthesis regulator FlaF [Maritimibacter sp. 55A14]PWE32370.1 flagellar biosynthesis regulatory protein FlaF [Maritimibacter sp. 55A14]